LKKTLFIDARKGGDFTLDAVWAGLVDRNGFENMIDWPPSEKHREGIPTVTGDVERDYGAERRSLCYTSDHGRLRNYDAPQINELIKSGQIERIFIDEREESYVLYLQLVARYYDIPVVVVAGHDRFLNTIPQLHKYYDKNLEKIFMDNWRPEYNSSSGVCPMSYATNFDHLWDVSERDSLLNDKVYDICFTGYNSHGDRGKIIDHLVEKYGEKGNCLFVEKRPNTMECFLPKREYFKKIAKSRVCLNLRGAAECGKALRFYEIPYVGSYMLSQRDQANQVMPFISRIHCDYFTNIEEMDAMIKWALDNPVEREEIARWGYRYAMEHHTARARVDHMYYNLRNDWD